MALEKFGQFRTKSSSFISITKSKSFGFGGAFLKEYGLYEKKYVELFFDRESKVIGFKFTANKIDKNAFKIISPSNTDSKSIVAHSFFRTYLNDVKIDDYESRYVPDQIHDPEHGTLYIIQLKTKANQETVQ